MSIALQMSCRGQKSPTCKRCCTPASCAHQGQLPPKLCKVCVGAAHTVALTCSSSTSS
jgi:hypothetical protein